MLNEMMVEASMLAHRRIYIGVFILCQALSGIYTYGVWVLIPPKHTRAIILQLARVGGCQRRQASTLISDMLLGLTIFLLALFAQVITWIGSTVLLNLVGGNTS
jgi:hypothetical protein